MSRSSSQRGLTLTFLLLVILGVIADLSSPNSLLVAAWHELTPDPVPASQQRVDVYRKALIPEGRRR